MSTLASIQESGFPKERPDDDPTDVLFSSVYGVRSIELNRPKKLNSLDGSMIRKVLPRLAEWRKSDLANIIIISGAGEKAFCAGGDVAALAKQNSTPEGQQASKDYFAQEYQLDHYIATYDKPYIAIMDGITMGGGVGLSVHAPFRIATERTVFAMPETDIGFFPDVGASFFLPRLDGNLGTYLAMTSERLTGADVYRAGIATHYLDSSVLAPLINRLAELTFPDHYNLFRRNGIINDTIHEFTTELPPSPPPNPDLLHTRRFFIDTCFNHDTLSEVEDALRSIPDIPDQSWASQTLQTLSSRCPLSLAVTLRQMQLGRSLSIADTFRREHAVAAHFMSHPASDFNEGIHAKLIEKPKRDPTWSSKSVDPAQLLGLVQEFWRPPSKEEELPLVATGRDYRDYQWQFGLPSEAELVKVMEDPKMESASPEEKVKACVAKWAGKPWVREKAEEILRYEEVWRFYRRS